MAQQAAFNIVKGELSALPQAQGVLFIPGSTPPMHGLLKAFVFEPNRVPKPTSRSLEEVGKDNTKARIDIEQLLKLQDTYALNSISVKRVVANKLAMNAFVDTPGADVKAGFSKDSDYEIELSCTDAKITRINDSGASQNNRLNVIKKYASKYAEMDMELPFLTKSGNPVASGRSDIIVGFVHSECTADFDMIPVRVGNSFDAEVGDGLQGAGAGLDFLRASSSLLDQSDQGKLTFAAQFVVVHLRRTSKGEFHLQADPFFVKTLDDRLLRKIFKKAVPGMLTTANKMQLKKECLRNVWFKSLDNEDMDDAVEEGASKGQPIYDENGNRAVVFTTPLYSDQEAIEVQYKMRSLARGTMFSTFRKSSAPICKSSCKIKERRNLAVSPWLLCPPFNRLIPASIFPSTSIALNMHLPLIRCHLPCFVMTLGSQATGVFGLSKA